MRTRNQIKKKAKKKGGNNKTVNSFPCQIYYHQGMEQFFDRGNPEPDRLVTMM